MSNDKMRGALVAARAGLVWYIESYPQDANGCDDEMLEQIDAALDHKSEVSQEPVGEVVLCFDEGNQQSTTVELFDDLLRGTKLYASPPDYEALKQSRTELAIGYSKEKERVERENEALKLHVAALEQQLRK